MIALRAFGTFSINKPTASRTGGASSSPTTTSVGAVISWSLSTAGGSRSSVGALSQSALTLPPFMSRNNRRSGSFTYPRGRRGPSSQRCISAWFTASMSWASSAALTSAKRSGYFLPKFAADTGPDENQLRDALAVLQRKVDRHARADGTAHQVNGLQLE